MTTVVYNVLQRGDGSFPSDGRVVVTLAGAGGKPVAGTVAGAAVEGVVRATVDPLTGRWQASLTANSSIVPAGTVYKVVEFVDGVNTSTIISVPASGGPYLLSTVETDPPGVLPSSALAVEIARAEAAEAGLQTNINAEASTRASADSTNAAAIVAEATARAAAVSSEATTRAAADSALTASLAQEITDRGNADNTKAAVLTPTAVKTANYTAAASDFVPVDTTSGNVTITLPTAPADKTRVAVKMVIQGGTNTVAVNCAGSDVFNKAGGGTSLTLTLLNQAINLQYQATGAIWYVVADDLSLATLDARFVPATGTGAITGSAAGLSINGGGFTEPFDGVLWIAGATRTNPTDQTQGIYTQHRVSGDLAGTVHDAVAAELRVAAASNAAQALNALEASGVVTGGANTAALINAITANFHSEGTPSGTVQAVHLINVEGVPAMAGTLSVAEVYGLYIATQSIGTSKNYGLYVVGGVSHIGGRLEPSTVNEVGLVVRGLSGQVSDLFQIQNVSPTTLFAVAANGQARLGGSIGSGLLQINGNQQADNNINVVLRAKSTQTGDFLQFQTGAAGNAVLAYVDVNGNIRSTAGLGTKNWAAATPPSGADGDIAIGTDKLWVNDAGTWKSATVGPTASVVNLRKAADQSVTASTTVVDDDTLVLTIGANETWLIEWNLFVAGTSTTPDFKATVSAPTGATGVFGAIGLDSGATSSTGNVRDNASTTLDGSVGLSLATTNGTQMHLLKASVANGANAGSVKLRWAQVTSDPSNTTVKAGSFMTARRVA